MRPPAKKQGPRDPVPKSTAASCGERLTDEEYNELHTRWSNVSRAEMKTISYEDFIIYTKYSIAYGRRQLEEKRTKEMEVSADERKLAVKQLDEAKRREAIETREMRKIFKKYRFDDKTFKSDIGKYGSLYVFCVGYAKLESPTYKGFMQSLTDDQDNYKVYFARNKALVYSVGWVKELTPEEEKLKRGDSGYKAKEFDTGLHEIGTMLDGDDCSGVLLTNKTEDKVLSKFREYKEFDFVKPGTTPMETLVFEKGEVLPLPPRSSAMKLCPKLKKLGMPVELSGHDITLTERFVVCDVGKRVTENAAQILILLERKMFNFVLIPLGCWNRTTKETKYYDLDLPCRE